MTAFLCEVISVINVKCKSSAIVTTSLLEAAMLELKNYRKLIKRGLLTAHSG